MPHEMPDYASHAFVSFSYHHEEYNTKFDLDLALVNIFFPDTPTPQSFSSSAKSATHLANFFEAIANESMSKLYNTANKNLILPYL